MANQLTKKTNGNKKRVLLNKKIKLKKITIIKKAKALQKRKKKILVNKKVKFKKITVLKKRKKVESNSAYWKKRAAKKKAAQKRAAQKKWRQRKWRKKKKRNAARAERNTLQLVSGDTVAIPIEQSVETVQTVNKVETVETVEAQPTSYVSGELYNPIFSFNVESPQVQVDHQLWDSVKENLPTNYMIPDSEVIEVLSPTIVPAIYPAESTTIEQTLDDDFLAVLSQPVDVPLETILSEPEQESQSQLTKADVLSDKLQFTEREEGTE